MDHFKGDECLFPQQREFSRREIWVVRLSHEEDTELKSEGLTVALSHIQMIWKTLPLSLVVITSLRLFCGLSEMVSAYGRTPVGLILRKHSSLLLLIQMDAGFVHILRCLSLVGAWSMHEESPGALQPLINTAPQLISY